MPNIIEATAGAYGQFLPNIPDVWVPNGVPILPERRLLVPEPAVKFDKLTAEQMGLAHGRIAERPPSEIVDRLHGLSFDAKTGFFLRAERFVSEGHDYARAYAVSITDWMKKRGASEGDLAKFNPAFLDDPKQLGAYVSGMDRIPYGNNLLLHPEGYVLGFAVGIARDYELGVSFEGVPTDRYEYNAFLDGLSGIEVPREFDSLVGRIPELQAFQLGNKIHEIAEQEPLPQAA